MIAIVGLSMAHYNAQKWTATICVNSVSESHWCMNHVLDNACWYTCCCMYVHATN